MTRFKAKASPGLFQVWKGILDTTRSAADNLKYETHYVAEHDLIITGSWWYGLSWNAPDGFEGTATELTRESIAKGLAKRDSLLKLNPNIILIGEVRNYDAQLGFLPSNSPFWKRNPDGTLMKNPDCCPGYYSLDPLNPEFGASVASKCNALLESGVVDGCFLDWAKDERYPLFKKVRDMIGPDAILVGNTNSVITSKLTPIMNGIFMEALYSRSKSDWEAISATTKFNQAGLKEPKLINLEVWGNSQLSTPSISQFNRMRATVTLSMTHSSGYAIYYPDQGAFYDHWHPYYGFYDIDLGNAKADMTQVNGAYRREFEHGTVIYNPIGNTPVNVSFPVNMKQWSTGTTGTQFTVPAYDGEIFVQSGSVGSQAIKRPHVIVGRDPVPVRTLYRNGDRVDRNLAAPALVGAGANGISIRKRLPNETSIYFDLKGKLLAMPTR